MEENLKILKVEYLSNHLLDHTQILNLGLAEQTIFYKSFKSSNGRRPENNKSGISQQPIFVSYS